jgi:hypothetical protein
MGLHASINHMAEVITGRIYRIVSDSHPEVLPYYGSTTQSLKKRWYKHKAPSNQSYSKQLILFDDVRIELVEEFVCESIITLRQREQWYIDNNPCCNKQNAIGLNIQGLRITRAVYYETNKEGIIAKQNEYVSLHREVILSRKKAYYEANKEVILARMKAKYESKKNKD